MDIDVDPGASFPGPSSPKAHSKRIITALPKGKACLECRKRKVKCDALSPCGGCIRMRKECVYEEEWERIQRLQGTIEKLEQKLQRLQNASASSPSKGKKSASTRPDRSEKESSTSPTTTSGSDQRFPTGEFTFTAMDHEPDLTGDWWQAEEPPRHIRAHLIQMFFDTSRTGFTIHKPRFWKSLTLPPKAQPHPALLNVMYLIACHHSGDSLLAPHQDVFLERTRKHLESSLKNRDRLLNFLSASTLLAYYFLKTGRFLEASYQISSTARFAIFCGLHKIKTPAWKPPSTFKEEPPPGRFQTASTVPPILPPPIDAVDLGERINLFWMIVLVDHSASLITGLPTSVDYEHIETVWPRGIDDYESGAANGDRDSVRSLFELDTPPSSPDGELPTSETTLLRQRQVQAIVLLERVVRFGNWAKGLPPEEIMSERFQGTFRTHYEAVARQLAITPPLNISAPAALSPSTSSSHLSPTSPDSIGLGFARAASTPRSNSLSGSTTPPPTPKFLLVHVYCQISYVHLYNALLRGDEDGMLGELIPGTYQKRLEVAKQVLADIRALAASGTDFRKHLMMQGFAWGVVARVFAQHIRRLKADNVSEDDPILVEARQDLADTVTPIRILCGVFPILEFQLERLRVEENG